MWHELAQSPPLVVPVFVCVSLLRYESSTLILYKELISPIFQSLSVSGNINALFQPSAIKNYPVPPLLTQLLQRRVEPTESSLNNNSIKSINKSTQVREMIDGTPKRATSPKIAISDYSG